METSKLAQLVEHVHEHFAKYAVPVLAIVTALSAALGSIAATLGGDNTVIGHDIGFAVGGLTAAATGVRYLQHRFNWLALEEFGPAAMGILSGARDSSEGPGDPDALPHLAVTNPDLAAADAGDAGHV